MTEDRDALKADASDFLRAFEVREAEAEADSRSKRGVAGEDGFVQVVSK